MLPAYVSSERLAGMLGEYVVVVGRARRVTERFKLLDDGKTLMASQEYYDPDVLENRGVRYIAWRKVQGDHVHAYDCDPSFAEQYRQH